MTLKYLIVKQNSAKFYIFDYETLKVMPNQLHFSSDELKNW